ncbi:MAG: hypothetical protein PVI01_14925 [Gemmatimonadales bacterium]|jgi:hypothetical protein
MFYGEFLVILALAGLVTLLLVGALGWRRYVNGPAWDAAIFVLLILYPVLWVAHLWVRPAGPVALGVHWVPLILVGLIVASIIGAAGPTRRRTPEIVIGPTDPAGRPVRRSLGFFFWSLMLFLLGALIAGYTRFAGPLVGG